MRIQLPDDYSDCPECGNQSFGVNQQILVCTDCGHPVRIDELEYVKTDFDFKIFET